MKLDTTIYEYLKKKFNYFNLQETHLLLNITYY